MSKNARKISVSLPADVVDDLDQISGLAGISRSAFLSAVLAKTLPSMREAAFLAYKVLYESGEVDMSELGTVETMKRYRSASKVIVDKFLDSLDGEIQHDLFSGK